MLKIRGRKDLLIYLPRDPEGDLEDISYFGMSDRELKVALKKPFIVKEDIRVLLVGKRSYRFKIPKGYRWNGANVPVIAWLLIGERTDPRFKLASCIHDYLCENHEIIENDRYLSTVVFETLCKHFGKFNKIKLGVMFFCIDNYQRVYGGWRK